MTSLTSSVSASIDAIDIDIRGAPSLTADLLLEREPFPSNSGVIKTPDQIAEENGWIAWNQLSGNIAAGSGTTVNYDFDRVMVAYYAQCGLTYDSGLGNVLLDPDTGGVLLGPTEVLATIWIYKLIDDMDYSLDASWGDLGVIVRDEEVVIDELLNFDGKEMPAKYRVHEVVSSAWEGSVFTYNGDVVLPNVSLVNGVFKVDTDIDIIGTLAVKYKTFRDTCILTIPRRSDVTDASLRYASTVRAFYTDGVKVLEIESPTWSEECEGLNIVMGPGAPSGSQGVHGVEFSVFDYCTGETITNAVVRVDGNIMDMDGINALSGGGHSVVVTAPNYKPSYDDELDNDTFTLEDD